MPFDIGNPAVFMVSFRESNQIGRPAVFRIRLAAKVAFAVSSQFVNNFLYHNLTDLNNMYFIFSPSSWGGIERNFAFYPPVSSLI
jgi:hypothetical protein